jgi:hypothetical protein
MAKKNSSGFDRWAGKSKIVYEQVAPTDNSKTERRVLSPFFWNVSRGSRVNTAGRNADVVVKN